MPVTIQDSELSDRMAIYEKTALEQVIKCNAAGFAPSFDLRRLR
jgi:hypothetical protein